MSQKLKVYGDSRSGNCYKVQLLCSHQRVEFEWQEVDILAGDTRTPEFLRLNPNGKIPLLVLPDGRCLPESNAILYYLADGSELAGTDRFSRAAVLQWMFFEQYSHEPNIATSRFIIQYLGNPPDRQQASEEKRVAGYQALDVMEIQLASQGFMAGDNFTIADIALYAYTHVADEGGFNLEAYPCVRNWLGRVAAEPGHIKMQTTPAE